MSANYPGLSKAAETVAAWMRSAEAAGELKQLRSCLSEVLEPAPEQPAPGAPIDDFPSRFGMIGESAPMQRLFDMLERVAPSNVPVLIHGETGSGKELVAQALHAYSPRAKAPMLVENCAAIAANLLESELFGHVRGAFTDANRDRKGTFVAADGGTVFLDEIGDMPAAMQAKLLRVLQDGEVRPVGATRSVKVDVRLVAASHRDLAAMVADGEFREDLYFRLNVITLEVPSLAERPSDIPHLAGFLLQRIAKEERAAPRLLAPGAIEYLQARAYPGNVRELENLLRRACAMTSSDQVLSPSDLAD